jgi:hypothetical protein
MMRKAIVAILLLLIGGLGGYLFFQIQTSSVDFSQLSPSEKQQRVIQERDGAIQEVIDEGVYQCCIEPPCTMCYMEANQWNNYQAGTCACDELIAQGKEPCPQCERGLCETDGVGTCEVSEGSQ